MQQLMNNLFQKKFIDDAYEDLGSSNHNFNVTLKKYIENTTNASNLEWYPVFNTHKVKTSQYILLKIKISMKTYVKAVESYEHFMEQDTLKKIVGILGFPISEKHGPCYILVYMV